MAINGDGLFSRARNAADKYKKAQEDEVELISEIGKEMNSEYVGAFVTGYIPDKITFENDSGVPDNIATNIMEFEESEEDEIATMKWRIWDFDGEVLRLISETPTITRLKLNGEDGYNYGVYEMNQICRDCFGQHNGKELKNGISVTNLRRSDIQKVSTYDYTSYQFVISKEDGTEKTIKFGDTIDKFEFKSLPEMWKKCDSKWSVQEDPEGITWERELPSLGSEDNSENNEIKQSWYEGGSSWSNTVPTMYNNLLISEREPDKVLVDIGLPRGIALKDILVRMLLLECGHLKSVLKGCRVGDLFGMVQVNRLVLSVV